MLSRGVNSDILIILIKNIRYINFTNDISYDTIKKTNIQAVSAVDQAVAAGMIVEVDVPKTEKYDTQEERSFYLL